MKKIILITITLLFSMLLFVISTSCNSYSGEEWLNSIFQCQNDNGYCLPEENEVFTERYYKFYLESLEIFEYPDFETEDEQLVAEDTFRKNWKDIYPLDEYVGSPFGRENGMEAGERLENVTITHISDLEYTVLVEYRDGMVFSNDLLLVPSGNTFLIDYIATELKKQKAEQIDISYLGVDNIFPLFLINEANTMLYEEASTDSEIVFTLDEEDNRSLIGLTAVKDPEGNVWFKCFYPKQQLEGWTLLVSNWDFNDNEKHLLFSQNLTLANLQLGANPRDAKRLLGKPQSENSITGPLEVSGYIDEDYIVTTTTMEYDGIQLIYEEDRMIHANITHPEKSFGWITVGNKKCDKDFLIEKFKLTQDDFIENEKGVDVCYISWEIILIVVSFDENELVQSITFFTGP